MLERHGLAPQKKWGQHFLVSTAVVKSIVSAAEGAAGILEVGPGPGVLTQPLSEKSPVVAFEVDQVAVSALSESAPRAQVLHADALGVDLRSTLEALETPRYIVSNMPYNITGPLLAKFAEVRGQVAKLILMMQAEVGRKILAPPRSSDRGAISVLLQAQFEIRTVCKVPPGCFYPPPKVDSIVLELVPREHEAPIREEIVRAAFRQPRKTLLNNLQSLATKPEVESKLELANIAFTRRPHELDESDWMSLTTTWNSTST